MSIPRTRLSINLNKVALVRNARGEQFPDVLAFASDCERLGADGITVHPRPDERHIRKSDVYALREMVRTELNVEGYPSEDFLEMMERVLPDQVTLVPDPPDALTSSAGWDTLRESAMLQPIIQRLQSAGCRVSLFLEPKPDLVRAAADCGADRIEFYTGPYARQFASSPREAIRPYREAAVAVQRTHMMINAGHDLNIPNLEYWCSVIPETREVSIGHAFWVDAWQFGLENTLQLYQRAITRGLSQVER